MIDSWGVLLLAAAFSGVAAQGSRLTTFNRSIYLDGNGPHFFRAVYYSPTPWLDDADVYFKTEYYQEHWPSLFQRDIQLMGLMGANAIRIHGTFGISNNLGRHTVFLDEAYANGMSVFLSFGMVEAGTGNPFSLAGTAALDSAALSLRQYLLAARHPATVLVFLGDR